MPWLMMGLAALFYAFDFFVQVVPEALVHPFQAECLLNGQQIGLLSSITYLGLMVMQIPTGILLARYSIRVVLGCAVLVAAVGLLLFSQAQSFFCLGLARFLSGVSGAFAFSGGAMLAMMWFGQRTFTVLIGGLQLIGCTGAVFGLSLTEWAVGHYYWRSVIAAMAVMMLFLSMAICCVVRGRMAQPCYSFVQLLHESCAKLRERSVLIVLLFSCLSWAPVSVLGALWGGPFLAATLSITKVRAGELCGFFWVGMAAFCLMLGMIKWRSNPGFGIVGLPSALALVAFGVFAILGQHVLPEWLVALSFFCVGGFCSLQLMSYSWLKTSVDERVFPVMSAFNTMVAMLGATVAQLVVSTMIHHHGAVRSLSSAGGYMAGDFVYAFNLLSLVVVLAFAAAAVLIRLNNFTR